MAPPGARQRTLTASALAWGWAAVLLLSASAASGATDFVLPATGRLGAWLLVGPYRLSDATDDGNLNPFFRAPGPASSHPGAAGSESAPRWGWVGQTRGPVDVRRALGLRSTDGDAVAFAAVRLRARQSETVRLLLGADDGVRVYLDGKPVYSAAATQPYGEEAHAVPLSLNTGEHTVVVRLAKQRNGPWQFRGRLVGRYVTAPETVSVDLPGLTQEAATELGARLAAVTFQRAVTSNGYAPRVRIAFGDGAPRLPSLPFAFSMRHARTGRAVGGSVRAQLGDFFRRDLRGLSGELASPNFDGDRAAELECAAEQGDDLVLDARVGPRPFEAPFAPRAYVRQAVARATEALVARTATHGTAAGGALLPAGTLETLAHLRGRLVQLASNGDRDLEALKSESAELRAAADDVLSGRDPWANRTGPMRRAILSSVDGELSEFALYVPPSFSPHGARRYPLVVALHGLNGTPMQMLRWFFGGDDPDREAAWEDRHVGPLPSLEAFVVAPGAFGNSMYRHFGEADVLEVVQWMRDRYPIDEARISITGPSMGGIGAASLAFRFPGLFAAAAPLCGYHSYFVRSDIRGRSLRPWEDFLAKERSNVEWAWNGQRIPLYVVHGTRDLPTAHSDVLIERYEALGYPIEHEHPDAGHNVWQQTYEGLKGATWLLRHTRDLHPREVRFRTAQLRHGNNAWVHVLGLARGSFAQVDARVRSRNEIVAETRGVHRLRFDRDAHLVEADGPIVVRIDGQAVEVPGGEPLLLERRGSRGWALSSTAPQGDRPQPPLKAAGIEGPFRDVFFGPTLFVFGTDGGEGAIQEEVARRYAEVRPGATVRFSVLSDAEFEARGERLDGDRNLFLVGRPETHKLLRALDPELPFAVDASGVSVRGRDGRFAGADKGVAYIYPNPRRRDRYVAVISGASPWATYRALSLPELLPDFAVYDERVAPARGQMVLGSARLAAAGFFRDDWSLPDEPFGLRGEGSLGAARASARQTPF